MKSPAVRGVCKARVTALVLGTLLAAGPFCHADELHIPFAVKVEKLRKDLKAKGLDFYGRDESRGFIEDKGYKAIVYSFKSLAPAELETIKAVAFESER